MTSQVIYEYGEILTQHANDSLSMIQKDEHGLSMEPTKIQVMFEWSCLMTLIDIHSF